MSRRSHIWTEIIVQNFNDAFTALIGNEGGYSNNPADPGGETMWGITKTVAVANGYTGDMKALPLATAQAIAKASYWNPCGCDSYNPNLAFQIFDAAYNAGVGRAAQWLQAAAGVTVDGSVGPVTIAAVASLDWRTVTLRFNAQRLAFYTSLGTWSTFGKGWTNRVANNLKLAGSV